MRAAEETAMGVIVMLGAIETESVREKERGNVIGMLGEEVGIVTVIVIAILAEIVSANANVREIGTETTPAMAMAATLECGSPALASPPTRSTGCC